MPQRITEISYSVSRIVLAIAKTLKLIALPVSENYKILSLTEAS